MQKTFLVTSIDDTLRLAARLGGHLHQGDVVCLHGDLGAGKSAFARAMIQSLPGPEGQDCSQEEVPSPTFSLVQTYDREIGQIWHMDLYRLSEPEEALELGIEEAFSQAISLIEWPERLGQFLPKERLDIFIHFGQDEQQRNFCLSGTNSWQQRLGQLTI